MPFRFPLRHRGCAAALAAAVLSLQACSAGTEGQRQQAIDAARSRPRLRTAIRQRLELYERGEDYVDSRLTTKPLDHGTLSDRSP